MDSSPAVLKADWMVARWVDMKGAWMAARWGFRLAALKVLKKAASTVVS
jgi:hypothetical protein